MALPADRGGRIVRRGAFCTAAAAALHVTPALSAHLPALGARLPVGLRQADGVALTFDDGPDPRATPRLLELLDRHAVTATFFVVGEQVRRAPALLREVADAGHAIGVHGDRHRSHLLMTPRQLADDRRRAIAAIAAVTAVPPRLHRPPYGALAWADLRVDGELGLDTWLWSRWGRDWRRRARPAQVAAELVGDGLRPGDVLLLHDSDRYGSTACWETMLAALPAVIDAIAAADLATVPLRPRVHRATAPAGA